MKNKLIKLALIGLLATVFACGGKEKKPSKRPTPPPTPTTDYLITISTKFGNMKAVLYRETPGHRKKLHQISSRRFLRWNHFP